MKVFIELAQEIQTAGPIGKTSMIISIIGAIFIAIFFAYCWFRDRKWRELDQDFKDGWLSE